MISISDNSSSEEEDSQELQRLKDTAVTLEPDGDLYTNKKDFVSTSIKNGNTNETEVSQNISSRPSLRPKQTYSADPCEVKLAPGFKIHVAKKLSAILDKELEFRSGSVVEKNSKNKSSDSGIRLLSSSKDFLDMNPNAAIPNSKVSKWKPKSYTKLTHSVEEDKCVSSTSRKRINSNSQKPATSSSDSSDDEKLAEAAVSYQDIKNKDELLSAYATPSAPILFIKKTKDNNRVKKERMKSDVKAEVSMNGGSVKKKKKKKKCKENSLEEENKNREEELIPKIKKSKLCTENDSLENNEESLAKKKKKNIKKKEK